MRKKEDCHRFTEFKIWNQEEFSSGFSIVEFREKMRTHDISLGVIHLIGIKILELDKIIQIKRGWS